MKQFFNFITICVVMIGMAGCATPVKNISASQSMFWESFSIGTIVEENTEYLIPGSRQLFGTESGSPSEPFSQKQEEIILQIDPANLSSFLLDVQSDIEESIVNSGATIVGHSQGGVTGTSFSISYRENDIYGVVNVWGAHGEGTTYYLLAMVTEGR